MRITINNLENAYKSKKVSVETMELKGYEFIENLFVDSSGFGQEDEPALTQSQFMKRLTELVKEYGCVYTAISGAGMFQVNLGVYKKAKKKMSKVLASNVLEINYPNGNRAIRLYDTDIVTFTPDHKMILNHGGWETITTSKRMNQFIPKGYVYRKNWQMYYGDTPITNEGLTVQL